MMDSRAHEYVITIDSVGIDLMGHIKNAIYVKWVQAAVIDHWRRIVGSL